MFTSKLFLKFFIHSIWKNFLKTFLKITHFSDIRILCVCLSNVLIVLLYNPVQNLYFFLYLTLKGTNHNYFLNLQTSYYYVLVGTRNKILNRAKTYYVCVYVLKVVLCPYVFNYFLMKSKVMFPLVYCTKNMSYDYYLLFYT